jgi:hypothetical protein
MATKVFVSPGVYTTETELAFVAQSVGVTTLGLVGETLKGPAFEPIFVTNYEEFQDYFGTTSPEKFVNTQIPKYELAYIAKAYLQQSNQLFVTRILGLSGYDAGPSWTITTIANVDSSTVANEPAGGTPWGNIVFSANSTSAIIDSESISSPELLAILGATYTKFDGSVSSISADMATAAVQLFNSTILDTETALVWGPIDNTDYQNEIVGLSAVTNNYGVNNLSLSGISYTDRTNDAWYFGAFSLISGDTYSGLSFYAKVASTSPTFTFDGDVYTFTGTAYSDFNNVVMATLRSRGISEYSSTKHGTQFQVTGTGDANMVTTGSYANIASNPQATFAIAGTQYNGNPFNFEVSLDDSAQNYISKVLGKTNFEKERADIPLFVEEAFGNLLYYGYNKGYIKGLNSTFITHDYAEANDPTSLGNYLERYQTAVSPWIVSELRGNTIYQLFRFITISDGDSANRQVKVSFANMTFNNLTFDVLIRDFNDTDANPVVIEKYTNCSMDPGQNNYIGKKIGTADGTYQINSKYIMLEVNEDAPFDSLPCGFEGYTVRTYESNSIQPEVFPAYKTRYFYPGEVIWNPPFGTSTGGEDATISNGENIRRAFLGISDTVGWDNDFFKYKGKQNPADWACTEQDYNNWVKITKGFHMDSGATAVTISSIYLNSGETAFDCGITSFQSDPDDSNNPYYRTFSRKFTVFAAGGFDGWDIYRENRTNGDNYQLGKSLYLAGAKEGCQPYPNASGWGMFRQITVEDNTSDYANTDFYAYKIGIETLNNPAIININVLATPGVDSTNNYQLVKAAIDMVEIDRADSIYVMTTPDFDLYQPSPNMTNFIYPQDAVDDLANEDIDSNYTVTYYPWVLTRDSVFNTQIYIPPTAEVCRNLALTDNISFPWFATAGYTRGIVNSVRARRRLTQLDRDTLYQGRINPIATFNDVGTVIWGNKTLQLRESPLDRINVRRLLLQARKLISAVAIRLLFEQNDAVVRQQFLDSVNPILDAIRRDRGITDFRVTVSNNPEDFDSNQMSGRIFLKPTKALEFIDIEFIITPQGASFENI